MATGMMQSKPEGTGTYTYSSHPRAVQQGKKYREQSAYGNIMYDRRIVRGNTYALHTLPASSQPDPLELQRQQESRRRALARKRAREQFKPRSPEPVEGRKHIEVQTELYLEEITDRVEEADVHTQTDAFLDRPSTPLFVPAKTGMDVATQIEEGDLFVFDIEVRPILEVLVGKTVEQALLEVMEEEELASLRAQQRTFEENRNAEVIETQRLEEQERRRREEKDRRIQQQREALLKEKETAEKIAARAFAQSYLADLVPTVFTTLNQNGFFYDPIEREVETVFMPFLMEETEKALDKKILARTLLDAIIRHMVAKKLGIELADPEPAVDSDTPPPSPSNGESILQTDSQPCAEEKELPQIFGEQTQTVVAEQVKEDEPSSNEVKEAENDKTRVDGEELIPSELEVPPSEKTKDDAQAGDVNVQENEVKADETSYPAKQEQAEPLQVDKPQETDSAEDSTDKADEEPNITESQQVDSVETAPTAKETNAESADQLPADDEQS